MKTCHPRMSPICWRCLASERSGLTGIMSCELQKLRLSTSPVAPLQALPPIILSARKLSLSTCPKTNFNVVSAENPFIVISLCAWYAVIYCKPCLKSFFLRVVKDESLFPPKCHGQPIHISTIEADLSVEELTAYRSAELEFTSTDRVYCAEPECAKFIPMPQRTHDYASCEACGAGTCMHSY